MEHEGGKGGTRKRGKRGNLGGDIIIKITKIKSCLSIEGCKKISKIYTTPIRNEMENFSEY